jgi:hypothetical protein
MVILGILSFDWGLGGCAPNTFFTSHAPPTVARERRNQQDETH